MLDRPAHHGSRELRRPRGSAGQESGHTGPIAARRRRCGSGIGTSSANTFDSSREAEGRGVTCIGDRNMFMMEVISATDVRVGMNCTL